MEPTSVRRVYTAVARHPWGHAGIGTDACHATRVTRRPNPTFAQYVLAWAETLLPEPAQPGTKVAIYRLLAQQSGLSMVPGVRDSLGRTGVAVGAGARRVNSGCPRPFL
jgi:hypothetical protein